MNNEYWLAELKSCIDTTERLSLITRTDNVHLLKIVVDHEVESSVIMSAINNKNCPADLVKKGQLRLEAMTPHTVDPLSHTMCPIPWNHIVIQQNGDLRSCCQQIYPPFGSLTENGRSLNISTDNIDVARNSAVMKDIRKSMIENKKHPICKLCWKEEASNLSSKRKHMLLKYDINAFKNNTAPDGTIDVKQYPVRYIDIRFGNLCNLKCRYCGPTDSNLWYEDYALLAGHNTKSSFKFYNSKDYSIQKEGNTWQIDSDDFKWYESDSFWEQIKCLIPYIDRYYFTGGEPTINKIHYKLLDIIIESGYSKNVYLEYNSNMVAIPESLYKTWEEFKNVGIGCSIDGIGDMANYLRPPSQWKAVEKNVDYLGYIKSNVIQGSISTTLSVFNVLHFIDMTRWLLEKNYTRIKRLPSYHILEGPAFMSIQVLPQEDKEYVRMQYENFFQEIHIKYSPNLSATYRKNFEGIINYMFADNRTALLPELVRHTQSIDMLRDHSLYDINPWLAGIIYKD